MFEPNAKLEFIDCVNQLLHEATSVFYFYKADYPLDDTLIEENVRLAGLLFDHFHCNEIMEANNDPQVIELLQSEKGEDIHVYARMMNKKIEEKALAKSGGDLLLLPDIDSLSLQIEELLNDVVSKGYKRKKRGGISSFIEV